MAEGPQDAEEGTVVNTHNIPEGAEMIGLGCLLVLLGVFMFICAVGAWEALT